jgi:serine/threonine-protein kinase SIK2
MSAKSPCSFLRNNPINHGHHNQKGTCRSVTRSPVDFREGRRASDGLVAQGILSASENPLNNGVAFNSQRLHEACKAKGVLELHLLQQEAAQLSSQYQSSVPQDEMNVRQLQHSQFHVNPIKTGDIPLYHCGYKNPVCGQENGSYYNKTVGGVSDISAYVGLFKNDLAKLEGEIGIKNIKLDPTSSPQQTPSLQKPPLQQQLMQHRLLQQKRQILQKQCAMETGLSRRQMLRQQSYKLAQTQQILPPLPLPLSESESEDLLAFQAIVEGPHTPTNSSGCNSPLMSSPKMLKTTHLHHNQASPAISPQPQQMMGNDGNGIWNNLPNSMQNSCQISEATVTHEIYQPLYQVQYYR